MNVNGEKIVVAAQADSRMMYGGSAVFVKAMRQWIMRLVNPVVQLLGERGKRERVGLVLGWILMWLAAPVCGQQIDPKRTAEAVMPLMAAAPAVDGTISEDEWRDATRVVGFVTHGSGVYCTRTGTFWFGSDGKRIYFAVRSELPPVGALNARETRRDSDVADDDDCVEFWLSPQRGQGSSDTRYFQFLGNCLGGFMDLAHDPLKGRIQWDGDWEFRNRLVAGQWESEASVSLEALGATADDLAHEWRVHVARDWMQPREFGAWSATFSAFQDRATMTRVRWDSSAPVCQVQSLGDLGGGQADIKLAVRNPGPAPLPLKVTIEIHPSNQPWTRRGGEVTLAPGEEKTISLEAKLWPVRYSGECLVTSADEKTVYFRRPILWDRQTESGWVVVKKELKPVDLKVGYYPYQRKLLAAVDFTGLAAARSNLKVTGANFVVRTKGRTKALAKGSIDKFTQNRGEAILTTPELKTGTYEVVMTLHGSGVPTEPFVQTFERTVWEWEHNQIGISRKVIPPFTPMEVKGQDVNCVLRSHTMNGFGLWDQVVSRGEPILAGPIRFEGRAGGSPIRFEAEPPKFTEKAADRITVKSVFGGGPVRATAVSEWDYDGMMKVTLEIAPSQQQVEALDLIIPIKTEVAQLMHASSDGIRANPTGEIPDGQGVVWDSTKTIRYNTYGTWIPYVWLGGTERGVCWFADTDRDWALDDKLPAIEIVRRPDAVSLRVHLVNTPTLLDRPRRIVFGLQTTPVKPMPSNWRRWDFFGYEKLNESLENFRILGQGQFWGAAEAYYDVYPRKRDFSIFEKFAETRKTGRMDDAFLDEWVKGYDNKEKLAEYRSDVSYGMSQCMPGYSIIPYTNARGGSSGPEGKSFAAESGWTEPTASYRDFAIYYFKKMMDTGIDGIYLDNTYLSANSDRIAADAFVRPDGGIQPSVGLFAMREYIKRIAVMYSEAGKRLCTVVHMTNGYIIPVLSFASVALDWEDKYGIEDFQDRFSNDFILAESIGRQAGLVPLVLGGVMTQNQAEMDRVSRTQFGVAAIHEIKIWRPGCSGEIGKVYRTLYEWGYGADDCRVFTYWEPGQPVSIRGGTVKALVLSRPGKAMILITDFGNGGSLTVMPDLKALGLKPAFVAKDAETGEALMVRDGSLSVVLKRHDFRMVTLE